MECHRYPRAVRSAERRLNGKPVDVKPCPAAALTRRLRKIEQETRFYITSLVLLAHLLGPIIRSHWAIENSLHWVMDMIFRDDECRVRTDHAPANFATIKHMAHNLIRKTPGKASVRLKRKAAGWDDDFLAEMIKR